MTNFDELASAHGRFFARMKVRRDNTDEWWTTSHEALGCSPLSALCDDRFAEVLIAIEREAS
jgi:hypothetical protein